MANEGVFYFPPRIRLPYCEPLEVVREYARRVMQEVEDSLPQFFEAEKDIILGRVPIPESRRVDLAKIMSAKPTRRDR